MNASDVGAQEFVRRFGLGTNEGPAARDARRRIDEIGGAEIDEHRPTALQERYRVAGCERGGGDGAAVKGDDHFRPGTQLKNRHVFVRVEADMLERGAQIKVSGGT